MAKIRFFCLGVFLAYPPELSARAKIFQKKIKSLKKIDDFCTKNEGIILKTHYYKLKKRVTGEFQA